MRLPVTLLCITLAAAPLFAELKIASRVSVTKVEQPDVLFQFALAPALRIMPGTVEITTLVHGERVRVEGLGPVIGLAADVVLISRPDGTTAIVQPSTRTFFIQHEKRDVERLAPVFGTRVKTSRKGPSDVLLAQRTERVLHEIHLMSEASPPAEPLVVDTVGPTTDQFGRRLNARDSLTADERQFLAARHSFLGRHDRKQNGVTIESWESTGFGPAALAAARAGASPAALGSAGFSRLAELRFPLRQILTYPGAGYRMETRVLSVTPEPLAASLFEIPAGYSEVAAPVSGIVAK